jgi:hypothetical protein
LRALFTLAAIAVSGYGIFKVARLFALEDPNLIVVLYDAVVGGAAFVAGAFIMSIVVGP